jgi:hypothetical protein
MRRKRRSLSWESKHSRSLDRSASGTAPHHAESTLPMSGTMTLEDVKHHLRLIR